MEEFDQFVQYQSLRKETEVGSLRCLIWNAFRRCKWYAVLNFNTLKNCVQELIESQEAEMGFNLFGGIDKEVEVAAPKIIGELLRMSNNNEHTVSTFKLWQDLEYSCTIWQKLYLHRFLQSTGRNDDNNYDASESSSAVVLSLSKQVSVRKKWKPASAFVCK